MQHHAIGEGRFQRVQLLDHRVGHFGWFLVCERGFFAGFFQCRLGLFELLGELDDFISQLLFGRVVHVGQGGGGQQRVGTAPEIRDRLAPQAFGFDVGGSVQAFREGGTVQAFKNGGNKGETKKKKQTSWYDDLTMAVSRRSNDLVAAAADLADKYGISPANATAWIAQNVAG